MKTVLLKENIHPELSQYVTVKQMGNITDIRYCAINRGCAIRKLDNTNYVNMVTGEVKAFEPHKKRTDDKSSILQSLKRLRELINSNVTDSQKCKWLTLTYAENMRDTLQLYEDFKKFNARLRYWLLRNNLPSYEYIAVAEPQKRGAWHWHCFLIFHIAAPYIHYDVIAQTWGHGAIKIKALRDIDNVGAYLTPYLTDVSLSDGIFDGDIKNGIRETEEIDQHGSKVKKAYIKGARLKLYPAGFRLYRASRGIKRPIVFVCTEEEALRLVGAAILKYEKTIKLCDEASGKVINIINYRQYNSRSIEINS